MTTRPTRIGLPQIPSRDQSIAGELLAWRGATYYQISGYDQLDPFLTTLVSDDELWLFVSSTGGITAGRSDASRSVFPYETVDRLHRSVGHTGPRTVVRHIADNVDSVWEPFSPDGRSKYDIDRRLLKHELGCELWFEETNHTLGMTYRYGWAPAGKLGWVRTSELANNTDSPQKVSVLDGVNNVFPPGVPQSLHDNSSCLVDAYRTSECVDGTALYRLTSVIVDRAEASEALRTAAAWHCGVDAPVTLSASWEEFIRTGQLDIENELHGKRASYLLHLEKTIGARKAETWQLAVDTDLTHGDLSRLQKLRHKITSEKVQAAIASCRNGLRRLLGAGDAFQTTAATNVTVHHVANVLFNVARGGLPPQNYTVTVRDFRRALGRRNQATVVAHCIWLESLPDEIRHDDLIASAASTGDATLVRLCEEYLPLVFSRRHGDPSRPWNKFSIVMENDDGSQRFAYQGNWRDIFQNWEALCRSFPELIEPIIAKFVNASTVDGFNPYRIDQDGIDWEVPDRNDPWSSIGYWGDHQIVYLLKLLEASRSHHPKQLGEMLSSNRFTFADVPYAIRPYPEMVANPQDTIVFDNQRQAHIDERVASIGTDGRLRIDSDGIVRTNLCEKLLIPILAKVSNLVPGGGIWMNTLRPEWNDANNALVGNGVSVVTACYLYRHLGFVSALLRDSTADHLSLSQATVDWMRAVRDALAGIPTEPTQGKSLRKSIDALGLAFSKYRERVYEESSPRTQVSSAEIVGLLEDCRSATADTIRANRRKDGLYHAYNLLHLGSDSAHVTHLEQMLEGQVAALSSGLVAPQEAVALLDAMRHSPLYREDLHTYMLYPVKHLKTFVEMNRAPDDLLQQTPTLAKRISVGDTSILERDTSGQLRFHADFRNAAALEERIADLPSEERAALLAAYESVFHHKAFTGRSGTMFGYEGIGSVYWHMNAKLVLAVQEVYERALSTESDAIVDTLRGHYYRCRDGLGFTKSPSEFGALPLDPYSHTPMTGGAKQPGTTGAVKEEILARWGELGVRVRDGEVHFAFDLLPRAEFLKKPTLFEFIDAEGISRSFELPADTLAFTYCQVPVVYHANGNPSLAVSLSDGSREEFDQARLPARWSRELFRRTHRITRIDVCGA